MARGFAPVNTTTTQLPPTPFLDQLEPEIFMRRPIFGPAADALASLSSEQVSFLQAQPKAELHAHLNGCIPLSCIQELAQKYVPSDHSMDSQKVLEDITKLRNGVPLNSISDFFGLFGAIYALTSTRRALAIATKAVLEDFLDGNDRQCTYLEIRSTPRSTSDMTRREYVETVLDEIEKYPTEQSAYILALDRRMTDDVAWECMNIAISLKQAGRRVVGVDLCGDPLAGDMRSFEILFHKAKVAGLGITLHVAETADNSSEDTLKLLSFKPDRLGHATFLDTETKEIVFQQRMAIEICLSSNLLCKTVQSLKDHHLNYHFKLDHPIIICTDDTLPFRNSLLGEYALLMAEPPLGLGLSEVEISRIAETGLRYRFQ